MRHLRTFAIVALCALAFGAPMRALAWGEPGHQLIGSIAEQILAKNHPGTETQVKALLGSYSLALVATWADCVRDVKKEGGSFKYAPGEETPKVCKQFPQSEQARMIDYASRNWDQCVYTSTEGCHAAYHFSDIAIQRSGYQATDAGAHPWDIEHAIAAALAVLQGKPCPAPFNIKDKTEALFMLAHFVGDLHQPLHVGAIYLSAAGKEVDPDKAPDNTPEQVEATGTEGGNLIKAGSGNLHHAWDTVATSLGKPDSDGVVAASATLVKAAQGIPADSGSADAWITSWADDSIKQAGAVYKGLRFKADVTRSEGASYKWSATLPKGYAATRGKMQQQQIEKAGAHLAELLAAALPGK